MGTWNTKIDGNDAFQDVYQSFFEQYNAGGNPQLISQNILKTFAPVSDDDEDRFNHLFALAFAQWETKSLDPEIYSKVKGIIERGDDLALWKSLGAGQNDLDERKNELSNFLTLISKERDKPKRRVRPKFDFCVNNLVDAVAPDGLKKFGVNEEFVNEKYVQTGGLMQWNSGGGGGVLYFAAQGKNISAQWLDSHTLEITHDPEIVFTQKQTTAFFCGDEVKVIYKAV